MNDLRKPVRDHRPHWNKRDTLIMCCVTLVYAVLALVNLGSTKAPQSTWTQSARNESVTFDLGKQYGDFSVLYYGPVNYRNFKVEVSADGQTWSEPYWAQLAEGMCYKWYYLSPSYGGEWQEASIAEGTTYETIQRLSGRYVRITCGSMLQQGSGTPFGLKLGEIIFRETTYSSDRRPISGDTIPVTVCAHEGGDRSSPLYSDPELLIDEQDSCEGEPSWFNSAYFDEIYHARTAKELLDGTTVYEYTHPQLGKLLMAGCIAIFGMTPFGWRLAGTLVGIIMLPAIYLLAKQLTKKTWLAGLAIGLLALDCMHFTQTRIATIDSFPVLFIILSYFFMLRFTQRDLAAQGRGSFASLLPDLGLSGLFFGLAVASKWIGLYAGAGLAVLFFWRIIAHLHHTYDEDPAARKKLLTAALIGYLPAAMILVACKFAMDGVTESAFIAWAAGAIVALVCHACGMLIYAAILSNGTPQWRIGWLRNFILCLYCLLFFIVLPIAIYMLVYIPAFASEHIEGFGAFVERLITEQQRMYDYHTIPGLGMDHSFYSPWYEWPTNGRPMYYASAAFVPTGWSYAIFSMGNPEVWIAGISSIVLMWFPWAAVRLDRHKGLRRGEEVLGAPEASPAFIMIGFAAQFLPWVLVPRGTYIYHYFASVPFIILATVYTLNLLCKIFGTGGKVVAITLMVVAGLLFIALFPYMSGITVPNWYLDIGSKLAHVYHH